MKVASPRAWNWEEVRHRYGVSIAFGAISILCIVFSSILLIKSVQTTTPIRFSSEVVSSPSGQANQGFQTKHISVDVAGAVVKPGVYRLPQGSRVEDALILAGGLAKEADIARIAQFMNRAAVIVDGAKLYFYPKSDSPTDIVRRTNVNEPASVRPAGEVGMVSVNSASQSELEALNGIGPATAVKIISNRPYQTLEELVTKKALSRSSYEKLKDQLAL